MSGAVLVTGGTGVIGSVLVPRLAPREVVCLQHRGTVAGAEVVLGDVTRPRLGLEPDAYAALAERVSVVVHTAAITDFTEDRDDVFAVNVGGAERILAFARDAGARLVHCSTAFVTVHDDREHGWVSARHYLDAKRAGDELVLGSDVDAHVVRPSVVIGDGRTGAVAKLQGYHQMTRSILRAGLPVLVAEDDDRFDFVTTDLVADALVAMVDAPPPESVTWLTAGDEAWPIARVVDTIVEVAAGVGRPVDRPRIVDHDMLERLIRPVFFPALPRRTVRRFEQVMAFAPTVLVPGALPSSLPGLRAHYDLALPLDAGTALRASVAFLAGTGRPAAVTS